MPVKNIVVGVPFIVLHLVGKTQTEKAYLRLVGQRRSITPMTTGTVSINSWSIRDEVVTEIKFTAMRTSPPDITIKDVGQVFDIDMAFASGSGIPTETYKGMKLVELTESGNNSRAFTASVLFIDKPEIYRKAMLENDLVACVEATDYTKSITIDHNDGPSYSIRI